ncbi:hypothetical protein KEM52_000197 [Ascosphaera acerosa]|nr:hypothetical protein KEM52_000197 [Ascosphaera acerosa]
MAPKRKASGSSGGRKRAATVSSNVTSGSAKYSPNAENTEKYGIVQRAFYPPEMHNDRCQAYNDNQLERPFEALERAQRDVQDQVSSIKPGKCVVHWFKSDLRLRDNHGLAQAYKNASDNGIPLVCLYILSPEDLTAHVISAARTDFILRSLGTLQKDLDDLDIPLYMETQENRQNIPSRIIELCKEWGAHHVYGNIEYEVDELRREARLTRRGAKEGIRFEFDHDACTVKPEELVSGAGRMYAVYKPWFNSWIAFLADNPHALDSAPTPGKNPGKAREHYKQLFNSKVPDPPKNKTLSDDGKKHLREFFPEGEVNAIRRLESFLKGKGQNYERDRNLIAKNGTSQLSAYFTSGILSTRLAAKTAKEFNRNRLDASKEGEMDWVSELAWRDFYKHILVHWPFICMNKAYHPEFTDCPWDYDEKKFKAWCEGQTGVPIVDASMRQLNRDHWMHNRSRMIVASFLTKDFLIDWRMGEKYFMETLIDGDFASNHGGWGFSSSTGVDPQPYFRIFNPVSQSEKFDPDGDFIRKWVPELAGLSGKQIHDPWNRGAAKEADANGYPRPLVEHAESRDIALQMFKEVTGHAGK